MNDRAIHHANNGNQQLSGEVRAQQSPPPTTTTGSPTIQQQPPAPSAPPLAVPPSRIPDAPYMALFGEEYDRLEHMRFIAAWKLSVEEKRLELCSGLTMSLRQAQVCDDWLAFLVSSIHSLPSPPMQSTKFRFEFSETAASHNDRLLQHHNYDLANALQHQQRSPR